MEQFMTFILSWKGFLLLFLIVSAIYIHFRGKTRYSFLRQLTDHSTFMAPINLLMYLFSSAPSKPYLSTADFPQLSLLKDNWETIREEALLLEQSELIKGADKYNDIGFNSFFRRGWKRFYLKWYNDFHPSALEYCPKTIELVRQVPGIKAAMFVVLPAGSFLPEHRDPYAGSLRYHLGLITPNDEKCEIVVDGQSYFWKDGEDVLFDETYIHHAENATEKDRLIFFCDVERPMKLVIGKWLNSFFSWFIMAAAASPNMKNDKTGNLNKAFRYLYSVRLLGKEIKQKNKPVYYGLKYAIFVSIFYLIFF
ncbi:aspartyl/asparaginyl beta-hydroxylase domain-containing protein [Limibacter armeniacum]|uniref:aspartyl/asparaginyl beta-hydroxylase domain-containing protein n=1 Tax=Limibacter armeniacum TaxID=466084 RepID=UPI002FE59793